MRDPVCGMDLGEGGDMILHEDKEYRFCCATCRWAFKQDPERYAQ